MSSLSNNLSKYIPIIGRKKPNIDKKQALTIVPVRHPDVKWERNETEVVLSVPTRDDKVAKIVKKIVKNLPEFRQIGLDEVGSDVWELCDGQRTIDSVVTAIAKDHKLTRREAEVSVTMFLQTLAKRNLIGLMSPGGKKSVKRKR